MPQPVSKLRVFIASPNDVPEERERLVRVIDQVNRGIAAERQLTLELVRWETHGWASAGSDTQEIINRQIGLPDIFISVMWKRVGTPTPRADSGTVEEFDLAFEQWRNQRVAEVMRYFKTDGFYPSSEEDLAQVSKVLKFRERVKNAGLLVWDYLGAEQFERLVHDHLVQVIRKFGGKGLERVKLGGLWEGEGCDIYTEDNSPLMPLSVRMSVTSGVEPITATATILEPNDSGDIAHLVLTGTYYNDEYIQMMYRNQDRTMRQLGVALLQLGPSGNTLRVHYAGFSPERGTFVTGKMTLHRRKGQ